MGPLADKVAEKLKSLSISKGLSQKAITEKTGLTFQTVNAFFNGRGKVVADSLVKICETLGIDVESLFLPGPEDHPGFISQELAKQIVEAVERAATEHFHERPESSDEEISPDDHDAFAGGKFTPKEPSEAQLISAIVATIAKLPVSGMNQCLLLVQHVLDQYERDRLNRKKNESSSAS